MDRYQFYLMVFQNLPVFFICILFVTLIYYFFHLKISTSSFLDSSFFYLVFTFGSAHGIVLFLYVLGFIELKYLFLTIGYMFLFMIFLFVNLKIKYNGTFYFVKLFLPIIKYNSILYLIVYFLFILLMFYMIFFVGIGALAEDNRFEQNSGSGVFVRLFIFFRLFLICYLFLKLFSTKKKLNKIFYSSIYLFVIIISSLIDGAKFALIESLIISFVCLSYYLGTSIKIDLKRLIPILSISLVFAISLYQININKLGRGDNESQYISGVPYVFEAFALRILANGDKYFLSLPNNVIEKVETKPFYIRVTGSLVSSTLVSRFYGENINNYSIGKQILLYWDPSFSTAGGPTSHFDLYAYKHFSYFALIFIFILSLWFSLLIKLRSYAKDNLYNSIFLAILYHRSWSILIEPPLGIGYIFDVLIIFLFFAMFKLYILRRVN